MPTRLAAVSPYFLKQATPPAINDWLTYFEPDGILVTGSEPAPRAMNVLRRASSPERTLFHPAAADSTSGPHNIAGVEFVFAPTLDALRAVSTDEQDALDPDQPTYICSNLLDLAVDTTTLTSSLTGKDAYSTALDPGTLDGSYIHISTQLPADYRREWDGLTVVGGGSGAGTADTPLVALDCRADGAVLTRTLKPSRLGLQALDRVGSRRAKQLREAGYTSREQIASATQKQLAEISGIGTQTAQRIQQTADALANSEIIRTGEEQLPTGDPVFVDIETDGLSPTITWLIGVLDGGAEDGTYRSFLQTDPAKPGGALSDFMAWYTANASHRPLVAYNGWGFDFEVLHEQIVEYCPQYEKAWTSTYRFDPYQWAVEDGNAVLPGRTNKLDDVAGALGYERGDAGLTGAAVARRYRQWMAGAAATEPNWEQFDRYCEDDVRALAVVYDALKASSRIVSTADAAGDGTDRGETTQGTLSDW